jgi:formamidopyrimidine-DNA glycosylase
VPELPEVETTLRGIAPHLTGRLITSVVCRVPKLRLPLAPTLVRDLTGQRIDSVARRGKYLLLRCGGGTLLIHLGMTGHLRLVPSGTPPGKYDHFELGYDHGPLLRLTDPRKFATVLWVSADPLAHPLLAGLGPEPLTAAFSAAYLLARSRQRTIAVKSLLMDSKVVVGVGNIYANEALFRAGVLPVTPAGKLTRRQCADLVAAVREVLAEAIELGGTTLEDFFNEVGKPGYFRLQLRVYGRAGEPCSQCGSPVQFGRLGGRSTYYCPVCQR